MNLYEFLDNQEETEKESFQVTDDNTANWALRKIKQHQEQQKENNNLAEAEIEKIKSWLSAENGQAQQSIDYFQGLLAAYALQKRDSDPKFKTMKLPNGRIRFKKTLPKYVYDDEALLETLKGTGRNEFINTKETPNKSAIKKAFVSQNGGLVDSETGEFIDGVTIVEQEDKFEVIIDD